MIGKGHTATRRSRYQSSIPRAHFLGFHSDARPPYLVRLTGISCDIAVISHPYSVNQSDHEPSILS
jgi:hypothetical protein